MAIFDVRLPIINWISVLRHFKVESVRLTVDMCNAAPIFRDLIRITVRDEQILLFPRLLESQNPSLVNPLS